MRHCQAALPPFFCVPVFRLHAWTPAPSPGSASNCLRQRKFCHLTRPSLQDTPGACGPAHAAKRDSWRCSPDDRGDTAANSQGAPVPTAVSPLPDCPDNRHRRRVCVAASAFCAHADIRASNKTADRGVANAVKNDHHRLCTSSAPPSHRTSQDLRTIDDGSDRERLRCCSPAAGVQCRLRQMKLIGLAWVKGTFTGRTRRGM